MSEEKKAFDVAALGELLIDFTENGKSDQGNPLLEANPGGAPCNVLSMLSRLHRRTVFIGKVGNDGFGQMLARTIVEQGISDLGLRYDDKVHTTLALVLKLENGDRDFAFYRNPGADVDLQADEPARSATRLAIRYARAHNLLISFDPNLREPLWPTLDAAKEQIDWGMQQADILKISDNEIQWFTGYDDFDQGVAYLQQKYPNLKLIALSKGPDGSSAFANGARADVPAFLQKGTIETTGAGDTFCACVLDTVLSEGLDGLDEEKLHAMLVRANAAASIVTTRKGALRVMPTEQEINAFIKGEN